MESNEKELKAKLYNNRAITHFKLGKMMRTLICIFSFEARGCQLQFSVHRQKEIMRKKYPLSWPLKHIEKKPLTPDINERHKFFLKLM